MTRRYLGIDIGGTNAKLAILEATPDPPGDHPGGPPDPPDPPGDHPGGPPDPPRTMPHLRHLTF